MMEEKIATCGACGRDDAEVGIAPMPNCRIRVGCDCGASGPWAGTPEEAIAAWNRMWTSAGSLSDGSGYKVTQAVVNDAMLWLAGALKTPVDELRRCGVGLRGGIASLAAEITRLNNDLTDERRIVAAFLEVPPCSTPSPYTAVPPDRETWDILCSYLADEDEFGGSGISEGRLAEILERRIGWSRDQARAAWFDAVDRGNKLIEEDHERRMLLIEAEVKRRLGVATSSKAKSTEGPPPSSNETGSAAG